MTVDDCQNDSSVSPFRQVPVLTRVAKTNYVVAKILAGGHSQARSPIFDFSSHKYLPVIRIQ